MKEKCGDCTHFSPTDDSPKADIGVCYKNKAYLRVDSNQIPKDVNLDGNTCFSPGKNRTIATQPPYPHTRWWTLIKRQLIK